MKNVFLILFALAFSFPCIAQKTFRVAVSGTTTNPLIYDKAATDTAISGQLSRAIAAFSAAYTLKQGKVDAAQDVAVKALRDSVRMLRDSIRFVRDSIVKDTYFGTGFSVVKGKSVDTVNNTSSLIFKNYADSMNRVVSGKADTSNVLSLLADFATKQVAPISTRVDKVEAQLKAVDINILKQDLDRVKAVLQKPILQ